ncbi:MAG: dihydrodipicolinate synthase family protein [Pseudomonadota bacterium]|nr:dihydrodipicolinate synthase family protein [Pseudomonadota bacterium]
MSLRGVLSPVLTPFEADGSPSPERLLRHCRWLLDQDVGLAVFGTNSEANSLTVAEKRVLLDHLAASGIPMQHTLPGTGACALADAVELTRHAVALGCAGVLLLPPWFYKGVSDEGLFRAFATVIDRVADARLRVYLYHIPPVAQVGISLALIDRLMRAFPGVVAGIKDSSGDWAHTAELLREFQPRGLDVFAGSETFLLQTLRGGGAGCITATGNVNPGAIVQLHRNWQAPGADAAQHRLDTLRAVFAAFPMIPAMKAAIAWQARDPAWATVRPPLVELDEAQCSALRQGLTRLDFSMPGAASLAGDLVSA